MQKELDGKTYAWCGQEICPPSTNRGTTCEYHYHLNLKENDNVV